MYWKCSVVLSVLLSSCPNQLDEKLFASPPDGPLEHFIIYIDGSSPIDNTDNYFDNYGYMINKKVDSDDISWINTSTFNPDKPYTIE